MSANPAAKADGCISVQYFVAGRGKCTASRSHEPGPGGVKVSAALLGVASDWVMAIRPSCRSWRGLSLLLLILGANSPSEPLCPATYALRRATSADRRAGGRQRYPGDPHRRALPRRSY